MATNFRNLSALSRLRFLAGFAIAPVVAGVVTFLIVLGQWYGRLNVFPITPYSNPVDAAASFASGVTLIAVIATAACAVPGVVSMVNRGDPLTLGRVLLFGAAVGQLPFILIVAGIIIAQAVSGALSSDVARLWEGAFGTVRAIVLGLLIGVPSAAAFWLIGVWGTGLEKRS
jgi:hypothetical protein